MIACHHVGSLKNSSHKWVKDSCLDNRGYHCSWTSHYI